jgi:hypothetical protein
MEDAIEKVFKNPFINPAELALRLFREWLHLYRSFDEIRHCFYRWIFMKH